MSKTFRFECGCQFDVIGECKSLSLLDVDINNLPENCPAVWDMLAKGLTTGVFQLEEYSGKSWVQKIKPRSIEELAALISLVRPGCLDHKDENNVNLTQHYVNRKNGKEEAIPLDESVKDILEETRQILCYQEQSLELVKRLAGFTLGEADLMRRGLGKKDAEIVRGCREKFIEGSKKVGLINEEKANQIFDMIQAGERYSFNRSHAVAYAITAYRTAWEKNHFPLQFLLSKLQNAHFKQDSFEKIADLVNEAKIFNIEVKLPSLLSMRPSFWSDGKHIYYGLTDIKGIGESHFDKLQTMMSSFEKPVQDISFFEFILNACNSLGESIPNKMIRAGALDHYRMPRAEMLYYLDTMKDLTEKELVEAVHIAKEEKITDFLSLFKRIARVKKEGGVAHDKRRLGFLESKIKILQNPVAQLEDVPDCICEEEENLLGAAISTHKIDGFDSASANASCKEILCGRDDKCTIFVKITSYFPKTIKSGDNAGKEMASMIVEDNTGTLQAMVYSKEFEQFNKLLYEKACVYLEGQKQRVGNNFIVRNVWNS